MLSSASHKKCLKYHVMDDVIDVGKELLITIIIIFHLACKQVSYIIYVMTMLTSSFYGEGFLR